MAEFMGFISLYPVFGRLSRAGSSPRLLPVPPIESTRVESGPVERVRAGESLRDGHGSGDVYSFAMSEQPSPPAAPTFAPTPFRCQHCGYDISGTAVGGSCPECGTPIAAALLAAGPLKPHPQAVTALVLGLLSLLLCMILGPFAWNVGGRVRREVDAGLYSKESRGMGTAGYVCGIIATVILLLYLVILMLTMLAG